MITAQSIPVGYVGRLAIYEGGDDVAEGGEGEVDLGGLLEPLARGARLGLTLRPLVTDMTEI